MRLAAIIASLLFAGSVTTTFAQGGGGRSESIRIPAASEQRRASRQPKRNLNRTGVSVPKIPMPEMGSIAIRISEGESQLQIIRDGLTTETIDLAERSGSLVIRKLDVGSYTILAKKAGFYDESRTVDIEKNKGRRVSIDLRPKMAILSVSSNVPDARISITNLGEFEAPVEKALVEPGVFTVSISRRGYVSRVVTIDLKTAGSEERLNLILEPLRVDAVIERVFMHIKNGRMSDAEMLAKDVLALNPHHGRANLALGLVYLGRGESEKAVDRLVRAIASGETFSLPAAVRIEPADTATFGAVIIVDARKLRFESSERPGLNFSITRANLGRVDIDADSLTISGHADYHGRTISPRVQVHTDNLETIRTLLTEWQRM